ncbi:MAG: hypothetical protein MO853_07060 [Candidatus Protistobacter heckmanni]|nr:hypothetical protein [Candidatus Protistobacter heckmanni]
MKHVNRYHLIRFLIAFTAVSLSALIGFTAWNVSNDRETTRNTAFQVAEVLSTSVEAHFSETVRDTTNAAY